MFSKLTKKAKEDKGNAVAVLGIMLIITTLLVGAMMLDITKAYQMKSAYIDAAKKSTQAAIMEQTSSGYLRSDAAGAAIKTYEKMTRPSIGKTNSFFMECSNYKDSDVRLHVTFSNERGNSLYIGSIDRATVKGLNDNTSITKALINNNTGTERAIQAGKFTQIKLEVEEGTENVILPGAINIASAGNTNKEEAKCQRIKISAKANIFLGNHGIYD